MKRILLPFLFFLFSEALNGQIQINEVYLFPENASSSTERFIELKNTGLRSVDLTKYKIKEKNDEVALSHVLKILIRVIEPMVPHLAEECWTFTQSGHSIISEPWPAVDQSFLEKNEVIVVIQINGKRRAEINIEKNTSEDEIYKKIKEIKNIKDALEKNNILKSIYVPNKILNIVLDS